MVEGEALMSFPAASYCMTPFLQLHFEPPPKWQDDEVPSIHLFVSFGHYHYHFQRVLHHQDVKKGVEANRR